MIEDRTGQQMGNYRLTRLLGHGSFAEVYLGEHLRLGSQAAIKVLRTHLTNKDVDRFLSEARTISSLEHPHIVRVLDFDVYQDSPFLVMGYAPHGSLRQRHPQGVGVPLPTIISYVKQIVQALHYAHSQGVIHRDIKPANMLLGRHQEVLLSDFGIAIMPHSLHPSTTQEVAGTVAFMAPEQLQGHPSEASDQYSLGILVYSWLCGSLPFHGNATDIIAQHMTTIPDALSTRLSSIGPALNVVVQKALAKEAGERFEDVEKFAQALEQAGRVRTSVAVVPGSENSPPTLPNLVRAIELSPNRSAHTQSMKSIIYLNPTTAQESPTLPLRTGPLKSTNATQQGTPFQAQQPSSRPTKPLQISQPSQAKLTAPAPQTRGITVSSAPSSYTISSGTMHSRRRYYSPDKSVLFITVALLLVITSVSAVLGARLFYSQLGPNTHAIAYNSAVAKQGVMFGFDAQHTHFNPYETLLNASNVASLVPGWTATLGNTIDSSPTVGDGILYVGAQDGKFYAFNASGCKKVSCAPLWYAYPGDSVLSSPAMANGLVYVGSYYQRLYAFPATGCRRSACSGAWKGATAGAILSSPVVANGVVYIGSDDQTLYAFSALGCGHNFCHPLWTAKTRGAINSSPAVAEDVVYVTSKDGKLYAFNASGCGLQVCYPLWTAKTGGILHSSPTVDHGLVYVGSTDGKLYAFNASSCGQQVCSPRWTAATGSAIDSSPAIADGIVYISSTDSKLYAFNASGCGSQVCAPLWTAMIEKPTSSATIANGLVYIGGNNKLYTFAASGCGQATCTPLWTAVVGDQIVSSPVVANGRVYIGSYDGKLYTFHLPTTPAGT